MIKKCIALFVSWGFSFHSRIFHLYGDVTITSEWLQILTYARLSIPWAVSGLKHVTPNEIRGIRLTWSFFRPRDTSITCRALSRVAVISCVKDLGVSRLHELLLMIFYSKFPLTPISSMFQLWKRSESKILVAIIFNVKQWKTNCHN